MELFQIDVLTLDGEAVPIADSSVTLEGVLGYEREDVPAAKGEHGTTRKAVVPHIKGKILFGNGVTSEQFDNCNIQVVVKQTNCDGSKRARFAKCVTASMGTIGEGPVDIDWAAVSGQPQWL